MAVPKFYYLKSQRALLLKYSLQGVRLEYYTGIQIDEKYYNRQYWKSQNVKPPLKSTMPNAAIHNETLKNMVTDLLSIEKDALSSKIAITKDYLTSELDKIYKASKSDKKEEDRLKHNFLTYYQLVIDERESGERLILSGPNEGKRFKNVKNITSTKRSIERYMKKNRIKVLEFEDINKKFYNSFRHFILVKEEKEISTFGGFIKDMKTIMREAKEDKLHNSNETTSKYFNIPASESDTVALTLEQIDVTHNLVIENKRMDKIRDLFLIGCYSALRFSDFIDLEIEDIQDNFIRIKQKKTRGRVTIPIMRKLKDILKKYGNKLPQGCTNQEFNRVIKDVMVLAGFDHLINVTNYRGGTENVEEIKFSEMVSSHTGRRTYATIMFRMGIPIFLIMSATGHKTEKSFLKYIRATNEDKSRMLAESMKKAGL